MTPEIMTASGKYYNFFEPQHYKFEIEAIAHSLSNQCRWTGNCKKFYSIAQHSVMVSEVVPEEHALAGLLHDGIESVMGDCSTTLKSLLPLYKELEYNAEKEMFKQFGISFPMSRDVKKADLILLATERRDLMPYCGYWEMLEGVKPMRKVIKPWNAEKAKKEFLKRYNELTKEK